MHGWNTWSWLAVALLAAGGCDMPLTPRAQQQLEGAYKACRSGDNAGAVGLANDFIGQNPRSKRVDEAYYLRGLAQYKLRNYEPAKVDLQQSVLRAQSPEVRANAALALGDLGFDLGDMPLAENMYRLAANGAEGDPAMGSHVHYRLGCTLQRMGRWHDADEEFHKVIYRYEGTEAARRATGLVNAQAWTVQAGSFGRMSQADQAARRLAKRNLPARAAARMVDGSARFVVQVGRYAKYEEAAVMLRQVRQAQADAFIVASR